MSRFIDSVIAYRILKLLVTPFAETDAYALGIIDERGKELKRMKDLNTVQERDAYTILHRLVFRIKRIVEKVPIENKKLATFAAALSLVKEHARNNKEPIDLESQFLLRLKTDLIEEQNIVNDFFNQKRISFKVFYEEAPANNASATPGVAGFTPDTIGVKKKKTPIIATRKKPYVKIFK